MNLLTKNIELIRKRVLEGDSRFIDLKPLTARVHLKLPREVSSACTRDELSDFIVSHCFEWGIAIQDETRLILPDNVIEKSGVNDIVVECMDMNVKVVSGAQLIDSVIEQCGFANAYDVRTGDIIILTKNNEGKLLKSETNFWPDADYDIDVDIHE